MARWVVYCAGNSSYILSPNKEPIRMLRSFQDKFGDTLDYVYFTDENEPDLDKVKTLCEENNIKLITANVAQNYDKYRDLKYINNPRWPAAVYWYCDAPDYLVDSYDYAIKCDGDMMCINNFDLAPLEVENTIIAAREPSWYIPYDKYCPNAGFQILNIKKYVDENIKELFRQAAGRPDIFNSDTPALNYFVKDNIIDVTFVSADYNYLLFDVPQIHDLTLEDFKNVNIIHFVETKPYNLASHSENTVKEHFAKKYLEY